MMGTPSTIGLVSGTTGKPWRRRSDRPWTRQRRRWPDELLLIAIPSLPRASLTRITERLIDRMDEIDGDSDVEANGDELDGTGGEDDFIDHGADWLGHPGCPVADPGGDPSDEGEEDGGVLTPVYGIDQSLGPINEATAAAEHRARVLGLERSPTGGWRRRSP